MYANKYELMPRIINIEVYKGLKCHRKNVTLSDNYHKSRKNSTISVLFDKVNQLEINISDSFHHLIIL